MKRLIVLTMVFGLLFGMAPQPALAQAGEGNTVFLPLMTNRSSQATSVTAASIAGTTSVFINEIHYDNAGTDTGEAIEIAGPAGTDLTGWSLVLYNGSGGAVYGTTALDGMLTDSGNGFGFVMVSYPSNGIQNGAPDGIALVDPANIVVQFLSYEGAFTAVDGQANGMSSTDIGVSESGSSLVGNSLQLVGTGTTYEDFTWSGEAPNTFGTFNTGQSFGEAGNAVVVINEIDYDQPGTDEAEFVEIKNVGAAAANLSDYTLEMVNGAGGGAAIYLTIPLPAVTLAPGAYYVVCGKVTNVANCDLDVSPDNNLVQNGGPDAVALRYDGELIDAVSYEGDTAAPFTEGSGTGLEDPGATGNDNLGISRYPDGIDTDLNNIDLSLRCSTPGAANVAEASNCVLPNTNLVINEVDYDQPGTDSAEFVELRNNGDIATDLSGWTLELVNGNGTSAYANIDLAGYSLGASDYFVVCADPTTVPNCDLDVSPDSNLIQNGAPDAAALRFNGLLVDAVSYEGDTGAPYTEGSGTGLEDSGDGSIGRCADGNDTNVNNTDFIFSTVLTPGAANECPPPPQPEACGDEFTPIYAVQGDGLISPLPDGTHVSIEGVVVGDFQNNASPDSGELNGFNVQDPIGDGDAATSDGIFVFASGGMDVSVGDAVRVRGSVSEFNDLTEITASQIWVCSTGNIVAPTALTLPVTSVDDFERVEGMLVTLPQSLTISEYFNFDRFGEIVLTGARQNQPTAVVEPGSAANALAAANALSRITLDDGRTSQNPDPAIHPNGNEFTLTNTFRGGDLVQNATGVLTYAFGLYRLHPTQGANFTAVNPRTAAPDAVGGDLTVASFNVLNYFTTLDSRGANDANEFDRQRTKIIAALAAIDADVVGLIEIENNTEAIEDLVTGLNSALGNNVYAFVDTGVIGTDEIKVAFIYKTASVSPVGGYAILDSTVDPRFLDSKNRPALAQTFAQNGSGGAVTVVVNHLKSKGSDCDDLGDPDLGDGAGNCNLTRKEAAAALVDWLATDPTGSGDPDFLIIGDLNSYDEEDPIDAILAGTDDLLNSGDDYTDLVFTFQGEDAYSYVFDGTVGYLDHALAGANLVGQVTGTTVWHINADEPDILDYDTSFKQDAQDALYEANAYRSSDHDPVIIGLDLNAPPACVAATPSVATLWPVNHKMVAVDVMGVTDPDGDALTIVIDSIMQDEPSNGTGDGNTAVDGDGIGAPTALVRAERDGGGNGRVYHIAFTASDGQGNSCSGQVQVGVPKSKKQQAVDDGALYDSTQLVSGSSLDAFPPEQTERVYLPTVTR